MHGSFEIQKRYELILLSIVGEPGAIFVSDGAVSELVANNRVVSFALVGNVIKKLLKPVVIIVERLCLITKAEDWIELIMTTVIIQLRMLLVAATIATNSRTINCRKQKRYMWLNYLKSTGRNMASLFEKRKQKQDLKTKKAKMSELLDAAIGNENVSLSEEELLKATNVAVPEQLELMPQEAALVVVKEEPVKAVMEKAYGIRYNPTTSEFFLTTIEYTPGVVTETLLTKSLSEVQYKLGKLIIEPLAKKVYRR